MKQLYWLIKREYWEYRGSFLWVPLAAAAAFLLLNLLACLALVWHDHGQIPVLWHLHDQLAQAHLNLFLLAPTLLVGAVTGLVTFFYSLNALAADRRDRSILFWRSLPLSDTATVLAKVLAGGLLAPAIGCLISLAGAWLLCALSLAAATMAGLPNSSLLELTQLGQSSLWLIALLPAVMLKALPTLGWLLLCSAWMRRPFLWALALPALALLFLGWLALLGQVSPTVLEAVKKFLLQLLAGTFAGPAMVLDLVRSSLTTFRGAASPQPAALGEIYRMLVSLPSLGSLLFGLLCIVLAIRLRGRRDPL